MARSTGLRYGVALGVVALATLVRGALTPVVGAGVPFILFFPGTVLAAWYGGLRPGLLATALAALVSWLVFLPPAFSLALSDPTAMGQLGVFTLGGTLISLLAGDLRRARQRAEAGEAQASDERERFRVTLASIGDAVIATDAAGRVTLLNGVAEALTGWPLAEAAGRPLGEVCVIVHESSGQPVDNPALRAMREGRIVGLANHSVLVARDGRRVPIDDSGAPIQDAAGRIVGAVLVLRDITERRRATDRFRLAIESASSAMLIIERGGEIVLVNAQAERLFGYPRAELLGKRAAILWRDDAATPHREEGTGLAAGGVRRVSARRADGSAITIEVGLSPVEHEGQIMSLATIVDVTVRQRAEAALEQAYREARVRQREAESLAAVARTINTLDLDTALQKIVDSAGTLLGADVATLFRLDEESGHMTLAAAGGALATTLARNVSVPPGTGLIWLAVERRGAVASDDLLADPRFVHTPTMRASIEAAPHRVGLAAPLIVQGRVRGALFVGVLPGRSFSADEIRVVTAFADQAAIVLANAELYREAERSSRAKDEFLAMLGHELRNPLGAIAGAAGVLKVAGAEGADRDRARAVIERQVEHLSRLVDDLLDVSRVTTGKIRLDRRPLDLAELVTSALNAWRAAGRFGRHELVRDLAPVHVEGDETRLEQVVGNLVGNALKYTPAGGRIAVRVRPEAGWALLEVADTGPGIPPNLGERIFELFVQGDRALDRAQGGLGIGLTLVKALIGLHGGTVEARRAGDGPGSVFSVRLPGLPSPPEAPPAPVSAGTPLPAAEGRRVVLIEDNSDAREIMRLALTLVGHQVWEAADGAAGVELVTRVAPDVAIVDVGLPGVDGYEVARRIRASERGRSIRLVALTGYGQAEDRQRALSAGFDVHVTKPVAPDRLAAVIAEPPRGPRSGPVGA